MDYPIDSSVKANLKAKEKIKALEDALKWYASPRTWNQWLPDSAGDRARAALAKHADILDQPDVLTDAELKRLWAQRNAKRQTPHAGPGRPRLESRCRCGAMTKARAKLRNHQCKISVDK